MNDRNPLGIAQNFRSESNNLQQQAAVEFAESKAQMGFEVDERESTYLNPSTAAALANIRGGGGIAAFHFHFCFFSSMHQTF